MVLVNELSFIMSIWNQPMTKVNSKPLILNGRLVADEVLKNTVSEIELLKSQNKRIPGLAVILMGDNPASCTYVKNKEITAKKLGIYSEVHHMQANISEDEVIKLVNSLNSNKKIDGILVQLPLPVHIKAEKIIDSIDPNKDVDGLHPYNLGKLMRGQKTLIPCTPQGVIKILDHYSINISGISAVVIGRSTLVGKPLSMLLLERNATITIAHSKTNNLEELARGANLLISAIDKPKLITKNWIKPDAVVIDIGINRISENGTNKLVGDVDYDNVHLMCKAITPVPGGVGPVTIAMLMSNTLKTYKERESK